MATSCQVAIIDKLQSGTRGIVCDMDKVVEVIRRGGRVGFLIGAGVSVAAGLPDFRSPGGMYDTLRPELLTATDAQRRAMKSDPTTVVSYSLFKYNQLPYHEGALHTL